MKERNHSSALYYIACTSKRQVKSHIDAFHEGKKPFLCCGFETVNKIQLAHHVKAIHERKKPDMRYTIKIMFMFNLQQHF